MNVARLRLIRVCIAFAGIFVLGAITGGAAVLHWANVFSRRTFSYANDELPRMKKQLELDGAQEAVAKPVVMRTAAQIRHLRREHYEAVRALLDTMDNEVGGCLAERQLPSLERRIHERDERMSAWLQTHPELLLSGK